MHRIVANTAAIVAAALVTVAAVPVAEAQAVRTFVSGHGADTGICGVGAPCRTFAYAITQVSAGGEITVLDSAGYGIVTINKALSITNEQGVEAAITVTSGDGIVVTAGANDVVNLTGITLTGAGGNNGITFQTGSLLNIKDCVARGFAFNGIKLSPNGSSSFSVVDTVVSNNNDNGILLQPMGAGQTNAAFFNRVEAIGNTSNGLGLFGTPPASGSFQATVTNSDATRNGDGFLVQTFTSLEALTLTLVNSTATNNGGTGIVTEGTTATIVLAGSTLSGNATGFNVSGGAIKSFGNNNIVDTSNTGTLTSISQR
jgi:hypothetical protein